MLSLRPHPARRAVALPRAGVRAWVMALAGWLAVLQLVVPSLGLMHQVVHHVGEPVATTARGTVATAPDITATAFTQADASAEPAADPAPARTVAGHSALHLFDGHSAADCQLFDQMALGLAMLVTPWHWDAPPPVHHAHWTTQALLLRKSPALFFARGPPAAFLG
ncbi:hypothetical protein [Comamonas serinivorans]|uniref:hypothetical protein n=1 Tax=Comamonas serinivorans TaxID=1082851 RepID=UPI0012F93639|nr:hypothetical protein [Comamonas serinivorans]